MATKAKKNGEELVEIKLFKDSKDYKDDLVVGVNGKFIKIKRGVPVKIKRKYAEVIEHGNTQDAATAELIEQHENEYREASKRYE